MNEIIREYSRRIREYLVLVETLYGIRTTCINQAKILS